MLDNETLNLKDISHTIDTLEYFQKIVHTVALNFAKEVRVEYDIKADLLLDEILYCGLILNELVTNAYKYAFEERSD
ncbi:MAG: hypothetical protein IE916_07925 [Epsilonproteobacteria bacterium]|nr:hypothetical protein [Campylobacterota bacterium]